MGVYKAHLVLFMSTFVKDVDDKCGDMSEQVGFPFLRQLKRFRTNKNLA
jgi:hypothetical protein